jgi:hypothetical protein
MYVTEIKRVNPFMGGEGDKKGGLKNERLSQNVYENNRDRNLTQIKFIPRPECS